MDKNNPYLQFVQSINPWWKNKGYRHDLVEREYYLDNLDLNNRFIKIFTGARRVGKTFLLFSLVNKLLDAGYSPKRIVFLNADLREIQEVGLRKSLEILQNENKLDLFNKETVVLIDEVQELDDWQNDLKLFYDSTKIQFIISGSSATLLTEKSSKLTGRFQLIRVLPLSLAEYIKFNKISVLGKNKNQILNDYLLNGGYPEKLTRRFPGYLKDIVDSTVYRDLLSTYRIRNPEKLVEILKLLADKITTPVSKNTISKDIKIDDEAAYNYLKYLEAVYIIFPLYRASASNRISFNHSPKYYFNDTGILNELSIRPRIGHLAENAVFLEFLRRNYRQEKYNLYYDVIGSQEYDFNDSGKLFEVKFDDTEIKFDKYELTSRLAEFIERPTIVGSQKNYDFIQSAGYDLDFKNIFDFLMGE